MAQQCEIGEVHFQPPRSSGGLEPGVHNHAYLNSPLESRNHCGDVQLVPSREISNAVLRALQSVVIRRRFGNFPSFGDGQASMITQMNQHRVACRTARAKNAIPLKNIVPLSIGCVAKRIPLIVFLRSPKAGMTGHRMVNCCLSSGN